MSNKIKIPTKNYIYLGFIIVGTILLVLYFYLWFLKGEENKISTPIMNRYLDVINYNELDSYLLENKDAVIYVSTLKNKEIRKFELDLKKFVNEKSLNKKILYLNITIELSKNKEEIIKKYNIGNKNISNVPCIMIFYRGELITIYDIKENNYDFNELELFLIEEGILE